MQSRPEKLLRWFIFSVLIALVPLALSYLGLSLDRQEARLYLLTARGELLLISSTIASAAVGELIATGRDNALWKLLAGGACMLLLILSSLFFATIQTRHNPNPLPIFTLSLWMFAGTLLASCSAMYIALEGERQ
jgi:hypothetical protein